MNFEDFWYVVALSDQLRPNQVLSRRVLNERLAIFRDQNGVAVALQDRCLHRSSPLSLGNVVQGNLRCPYHGWRYDAQGQVVEVPSEVKPPRLARCAPRYATCEQDGYIYVRLAAQPDAAVLPFAMPHYQEAGWETVRVINRFQNQVVNCVENFIDIPHTAFVHPGIFRTVQRQPIKMSVSRQQGTTIVQYQQETTNLGWYRRFLNRQGHPIQHTDRFYMPNITSVEYQMGPNRHLFITSQSVPETANITLVYTDVTYRYGFWNKLARPLVKWTAQRIIAQDIAILNAQADVIQRYGNQFSNTTADVIHVFVESIWNAIAEGKDPRTLPDQAVEVEFLV
jgi:phenylpropionate dioxygenase-like ring-hydroxylating dioxygenase large terminal subunit